jgi:hypothetical protein
MTPPQNLTLTARNPRASRSQIGELVFLGVLRSCWSKAEVENPILHMNIQIFVKTHFGAFEAQAMVSSTRPCEW